MPQLPHLPIAQHVPLQHLVRGRVRVRVRGSGFGIGSGSGSGSGSGPGPGSGSGSGPGPGSGSGSGPGPGSGLGWPSSTRITWRWSAARCPAASASAGGGGAAVLVVAGACQATVPGDRFRSVDRFGFGSTQWERVLLLLGVPPLPRSRAGSEKECSEAVDDDRERRPRGSEGGGASSDSWQPRLSACSCAARESSGR